MIMGQSPPSSACNSIGEGIPFFQGNADFGRMHPTPHSWCAVPTKTAIRGDILISVRAPVGEINVASEECCICRGLCAIRANDVDSQYLYYGISHIAPLMHRLSQGSTFKAINSTELAEILLAVPPLREQKKIAEILSAVDEATGKTSAVLEKIRKLKKELTQRFLTNGRWNKKVKKSVIGDIPVGWEVARLADLLKEPIRNGYSPICPDAPTGRWTLGLGALSEQGFRADKAKPAPLDDPKAVDALLHIGDLLVSRSNTRELVGLAAIYDGFPSDCIYPDLMMRVRVSPDKMESRFLELYLLSSRGRKYFQSEARGTSGSMLKINSEIVGRMLVPRPPLEEQRDICARMRAVLDELRSETHCLEKLLSMKDALMQNLLTGRSRTFHMK